MNQELVKIIQTKESEREIWIKSVESSRKIMHSRDMSDDELCKLVSASSSPRSFNTITKLIYKFTRTNPNGHQAIENLFSSVDESPYSLHEWIDAVEYFTNWLEERDRESPWPTMLGYLSCCSESPENKDIKNNLTALLSDMLKAHGYEG